ncbi:MAG: CPBP family intramembrane glutamate endopeptidase, partial [Thermosynechococcaceae cyanobacterium]
MKVYRPILIALTILVAVLISSTLLSSWTEPQVQSQLDLYQSDLLLQASEWKSLDQEMQGFTTLRTSFFGESPAKDALDNYLTVRKSVQKEIDQNSRKVSVPIETGGSSESPSVLRSRPPTKGQLLDELDLRLGMLYIRTGDRAKALQTWTQLSQSPQTQDSPAHRAKTAQVLLGLWSDPPRLLPNA